MTRSGADGFDPPTNGWIRIDPRKYAYPSLREMKSIPVRRFDSLVGEYKGTNISLAFDHGIFPID